MNKLVRKNKKGFTLTEMIVVIAIIGILAAVLIPSITIYISRARESAATQNAIGLHQEFIASIEDPTSEAYEVAQNQKYYVVKVDKYYVLLENGAVSKSVKEPNVDNALEKLLPPTDGKAPDAFVLDGEALTKYTYDGSGWGTNSKTFCTECGQFDDCECTQSESAK